MKCYSSYFGNPWLGLFIATNDEKSLIPLDSNEKFISSIEENLKTEITKISFGDSNLVGIYARMNSNGIIIPNIILDKEMEILKTLGISIYKSNDIHNANGNNIVVNDNGGIINPRVSEKERRNMENTLGVELVPMVLAGYHTIGSVCVATNKGFLAHYSMKEEEMKEIERILKVKGDKGTVNVGAGFVSLGVIANSHGYIAGETTSVYELGRIEESLGFI